MTRDDIIRMAQEVGLNEYMQGAVATFFQIGLEEGADTEREKVAAWMRQRSYATGHGDTTKDLLAELEWQIRESEREAIMEICNRHRDPIAGVIHHAIRARGQG